VNPVWGHVAGVVTLVLMLVFIGIWYWAWRPHHGRDFARLARLPLQDDAQRANDGETAS
jgi:cytochrome c oxidase cbb3-type subunit 4